MSVLSDRNLHEMDDYNQFTVCPQVELTSVQAIPRYLQEIRSIMHRSPTKDDFGGTGGVRAGSARSGCSVKFCSGQMDVTVIQISLSLTSPETGILSRNATFAFSDRGVGSQDHATDH